MLVCCDLEGISYKKSDEIKEFIKKKTGVDRDNIIVSCSHTHFSPGIEPILSILPEVGFAEPEPEFYQDFMDKLELCAKNSLESLDDGQIESLKVAVPQVLFNRRTIKADGTVETNYIYPDKPEEYTFSPYDDEVSVIKFSTSIGLKAMLVNFGCHPVTGGNDSIEDHNKISSDYPYYIKKYLHELYNCPVFFTLGSAGDTVPAKRYGDSRSRIGQVIADSVYLNDCKFTKQCVEEISISKLELEAETLVKLSSSCEDEFKLARENAIKNNKNENQLVTDSKTSVDIALNDPYYVKGGDVIKYRRYPGNKWIIPVNVIALGQLKIISLPFEVSSEISLRIKEKNPNAIVFSCTNGFENYFFQEYEFERGGYEVTTLGSHFNPDTADKLLHLILEHI